MHNFKELKVWREGINLVKATYKVTKTFPSEEKFSLTTQINRSAVSIPSNIAEGAGRGSSDKDFINFLRMAYGSSCELETQLIISKELDFIPVEDFEKLEKRIHVIQKMIYQLIKSMGG
jgi:four helix bundle protein